MWLDLRKPGFHAQLEILRNIDFNYSAKNQPKSLYVNRKIHGSVQNSQFRPAASSDTVETMSTMSVDSNPISFADLAPSSNSSTHADQPNISDSSKWLVWDLTTTNQNNVTHELSVSHNQLKIANINFQSISNKVSSFHEFTMYRVMTLTLFRDVNHGLLLIFSLMKYSHQIIALTRNTDIITERWCVRLL